MSPLKIMMLLTLTSMCWWRTHMMFLLMSLEAFLITMFMLISLTKNMSMGPSLLMMLVMMASSSAVALSLMVSLSRLHKSSSHTIWTLTFDKNYFTYIIYHY